MKSTFKKAIRLLVSFTLGTSALHAGDVKIFTSFGKDQVTPDSGRTTTVADGTNVLFTAPLYVYLSDTFEEQDANPENISKAPYRVRCSGYTMSDGQSDILGVDDASQGKLEILKTISGNLSVTWQWELQYAFNVESETATVLEGQGNEGLGQPSPAVGKLWISHGTNLTPSVDGVISSDAAGIRFRLKNAKLKGLRSVVDGEQLNLASGKQDRFFSWNENEAVFSGPTHNLTGSRTLSEFVYPSSKPAYDGSAVSGDNFHVMDFWFNNLGKNSWQNSPEQELPSDLVNAEFATVFNIFDSQDSQDSRGQYRGVSFAETYQGDFILKTFGSTVDNRTRIFASIPREAVTTGWHHVTVFSHVEDAANRQTLTILLDGREVAREILNAQRFLAPFHQRFDSIRVGSIAGRNSDLSQDPSVFQHAGLTEVNDIRVWNLTAAQTNGWAASATERQRIALAVGAQPSANAATYPAPGGVAVEPIIEQSFDAAATPRIQTTFSQIHRLELPQDYTVTFDNVSERAALPQILVTSPMSIEWGWDREVRYRLGALDTDSTPLANEPFLNVYPKDTTIENILKGSSTPTTVYRGSGDYWLNGGLTAVAGARYRTPDRRQTLQNFVAPPQGDFQQYGSSLATTQDFPAPSGEVGRAHFVAEVKTPSELNWAYDRTRFRAIVPLGSALNAAFQRDHDNNAATPPIAISPLPANVQLVPDLPDGTRLKVDREGPTLIRLIDNSAPGASLAGQPFRWDFVGQQLLPVQPYRFEVEWASAGDSENFLIEVGSGWPGDQIDLNGDAVLAEDGSRTAKTVAASGSRTNSTTRVFTEQSIRGNGSVSSPLEITIPVSGLSSGQVNDIRVELTGVTHASTRDLQVVLTSPGGQSYYLLANKDFGNLNNGTISLGTFFKTTDQVTGNLIFPEVSTTTDTRNLFRQQTSSSSQIDGSWVVKVGDGIEGISGTVSGARLVIETAPNENPGSVQNSDNNGLAYVLPEDGYRTFQIENTVAAGASGIVGLELELVDLLPRASGGDYHLVLESPQGTMVHLGDGTTTAISSPSAVTVKIASNGATVFEPQSLATGTTYKPGTGENVPGALNLERNFDRFIGENPLGVWRLHISKPGSGTSAFASLGEARLLINGNALRLLPAGVANATANYSFDSSAYSHERISVSSIAADATITSASVRISNLKGTTTGGDFELLLESPEGKFVYLAKGNDPNGVSNNSDGFTTFRDDGIAGFTPSAVGGSQIYAPSVQSGQTTDPAFGTNLASLNGGKARGVWRVHSLAKNPQALRTFETIDLILGTSAGAQTVTIIPEILHPAIPRRSVVRNVSIFRPGGSVSDFVNGFDLSLSLGSSSNPSQNSDFKLEDFHVALESPEGYFMPILGNAGGQVTFTAGSIRIEERVFTGINPLPDNTASSGSLTVLSSVYGTSYFRDGGAKAATNAFKGRVIDGTWKVHFATPASTGRYRLGNTNLRIWTRPASSLSNQNRSATGGVVPDESGSSLTLFKPDRYPLNVTGVSEVISDLDITLHGLRHQSPDSLHIALESPSGTCVYLLGNALGSANLPARDFTIDDAAAAAPLTTLPPGLTTFRPTLNGPALLKDENQDGTQDPNRPFAGNLAAFNGQSANGTWTLIVGDTKGRTFGGLDGGFSLKLGSTVFQTNPENGGRVYEQQIALPAVGDEFPGSPRAHYSYLYSTSLDLTPTTELDGNPSDRWAFDQLTFTEVDGLQVGGAAPFAIQPVRAGRTVSVYSYRPDASQVATGDPEREVFAVRLLDGQPLEAALAVPAADRRIPQVVNTGGKVLPLSAVTAGSIALTNENRTAIQDGSFALDFRMEVNTAGAANATLFDLPQPGYKLELVKDLTNGRQDFLLTIPGTSGSRVVTIPQVKTAGWHHYWLNVLKVGTGFGFEFFQDGVLLARSGAIINPGIVSGDIAIFSNLGDWSARLDNLRLWGKSASAAALREKLKGFSSADTASSEELILAADFDGASFATAPLALTIDSAKVGNAAASPFAIQEVANPLSSAFDLVGFNGGWIVNQVGNYNSGIYQREARVGQWGRIFPVNDATLYSAAENQLEVVYYRNPSLDQGRVVNSGTTDQTQDILHPNVNWPTDLQNHNAVTYPVRSNDAAQRIYIASRIGTEGVNSAGLQQPLFTADKADELEIYHQASRELPGFNPNEEHALVAPSIRAQLTGQTAPNITPNAAFALQNRFNRIDTNITTGAAAYTSQPWVLLEFDNKVTNQRDMAAYLVEESREGATVFPRIDPVTHAPLNPYTATNGVVTEGANYNFSYDFEYEIAAGDLLVAPYPLNLVIGAVRTPGASGLNIPDTNGVTTQTLWSDYKGNPYAISGNGQFVYHYVYPTRADFDFGGRAVEGGDLIGFLPADADQFKVVLDNEGRLDAGNSVVAPKDVQYRSFWRTTYPKLKRGESLAYQGGENKADNPSVDGLPSVVGMASAELVFDSALPSMDITPVTRDTFSARVVRPLDAVSVAIPASEMPEELQPAATSNVMVDGARWYFKNLGGSLSGRVYYDVVTQQLVLRGRLNGMESGDANLTSGIEALNVLEPSFLTQAEFTSLKSKTTGATEDLDTKWNETVDALYKLSQNPNGLSDTNFVTLGNTSGTPLYLHGLVNSSAYLANLSPVRKLQEEQKGKKAKLIEGRADYDSVKGKIEARITALTTAIAASNNSAELARLLFRRNLAIKELVQLNKKWEKAEKELNTAITAGAAPLSKKLRFYAAEEDTAPIYRPAVSFGAGSVLVPGAPELTNPINGRRFVTLVENNDERLAGAAVTVHVIELIPDRYRGGLKVVEPADAFSERIEVKHNAEFGGNTKDLFYEWYIREAAPLSVVASEVSTIGTATQDPDWKLYQSGLDLNGIQFEGRPDVALADQMFLLRYRHKDEPNNWKLISLNRPPASEWTPGSASAPTPFQWAGAANSPQLQADGSKRYIPQLIPGWVKRVLDRINPYEARYTDLLNNESPAVYSSMLQILGRPFIGPVALNSSKDVVEGVGLIELYETVLKRARDLTIDNSQPGNATDGTNQAILLAATRLSVFYELLGSEAYADYLDPTVRTDGSDEFNSVLTSVHAFQNLQNGLLDEGLALLRGTDFVTSYPSYNRLFWNYTKGLGEAAYSLNYNITDTNLDGFINEVDARTLYPQGHGDAWGHYLAGSNMHYALLRHSGYTWRSRAELYALLDNVIEADYLDEKSFAKNAAAKARAGRDIVQSTYRKAYSADPDGQWQGYDDPNVARAWGLGDWSRRAGQGAYFDFLTGNAILPESATATLRDDFNNNQLSARGLAVIERNEAEAELGEIASNIAAIQNTLDNAALGVNPLGLRNDSISFDIDPNLLKGEDGGVSSHFEQVYEKALVTLQNAERSTRISSAAENKLRRVGDDTARLTAEVYDNDLAYRTALIGIFGRPHAGNVGFGKPFPEGYDGPDTTFYNYLANVNAEQLATPWGGDGKFLAHVRNRFNFGENGRGASIFNNDDDKNALSDLYERVFDDNAGGGDWEERFNLDVNLFLNQEVGEDTLGVDFSPIDTWYAEAQVLNDLALRADSSWGQRPAYGELQLILEEMLVKEVELLNSYDEYQGYMGDYATAIRQAEIAIELGQRTLDNTSDWQLINGIATALQTGASIAERLAEAASDNAKEVAVDAIAEALPTAVGFSNDVTAPLRASLAFAGYGIGGAFELVEAGAFYTTLTSELVQAFAEISYEIDAEQIDVLDGILEAVAELEYAAGDEGALRFTIVQKVQELEVIRQQYLTKLNEGLALIKEREAFNTGVAGDAQRNRYLDMMLRLTRNEAQAKHSLVLENARRYTWLAAKAYEYEVNPVSGSAASATSLLEEIVKAGSVGTLVDGEPTVGGGGLSEVLALLKANHAALKGQLGINNPQDGQELISLRKELFRVGTTQASSAALWTQTIKNHRVENLWDVPAFTNYCRPFAERGDEAEPGLVIPFSTTIESGKNLFGHPLLAGDHTFSSSNYSTKIASLGVWFKDYDTSKLASAPRIYLVPVGQDYMRTSNAGTPVVRAWNLKEQVIPTPFSLNTTDLSSPGFIPSFDGVDGLRGQVRRFGDFRAYPTDTATPDASAMIRDSRLIGRSVWNNRWLLIIPAATLGTDADGNLNTFADDVTDIMLNFGTYTHRGL